MDYEGSNRRAHGDEHRERVGFLSGGAARAPDTDGVFAASAFVLEKFLEDGFLEKIELRLVAEETGLIDREIFQQLCQFVLALLADEQAVIGVERVGAAFLQAAQEPVLEEVGAALVEVHAALLVDECLQQLQFRFGEYGSGCRPGCAHK